MDNVLVDGPQAVLIDFGHAGAAPVGADLHTLMRYAGDGGPDTEALVAAYVEVFAARGVALAPAVVRRNLEAHFAARYRDLRLVKARSRETFETALALSQALIAAEGAAPGNRAAGFTPAAGDPI
jgi:Ser/Thr protein kinase RdoA (MazF antagonist)